MNVYSLSMEDVKKYKQEIIKLIQETMIFNFPDSVIPKDYYLDTIDSLLNYMKSGNAVVFAAFEKDTILGWLWCHSIDRFDSKRLHIASFAVKSETRQTGIGHQLIEMAEEYAANQKYDGIDLLVTKENVSAVEFYKKHGFEVERYLMRKVSKKHDFKNS
jgi:ribosomal protein S18 acetylase RimI-like enzyme